MESDITPQERKMMIEFIESNPIDHRYAEECVLFDGDVPEEQLLARDFKELLEQNPEP